MEAPTVIQPSIPATPAEANRIICGDCIDELSRAAEPLADLIFADPPFNIGYKYDVYDDHKKYDEYHEWTQRWMAACYKALKPAGSFWVAIGDEYAAEIKMIGDRLGLHLRNWVIWHYTFGQNAKAKFSRAHAHLFYWVKDAGSFTFNDMEIRIPSARQTTYGDKRANPKGRLPDDVWSFSRVCGTFGERVKWHPCQMPEAVLERIIRVSSSKGDLVLDPFSGSGTTLAVAARLGRRWLGYDISPDYVRNATQRIEDTLAGKRQFVGVSENPAARREKVARQHAAGIARLAKAQGRNVAGEPAATMRRAGPA
jgi:site-specific DNA-methyltransferase (adenine-specific)